MCTCWFYSQSTAINIQKDISNLIIPFVSTSQNLKFRKTMSIITFSLSSCQVKNTHKYICLPIIPKFQELYSQKF